MLLEELKLHFILANFGCKLNPRPKNCKSTIRNGVKNLDMFFTSVENIALVGCVFFAHTLLKIKPSLFFPLSEVPFLKLVKSETQKEDKKAQKKLEKQHPSQTVESFEKGVQIGAFADMQDVENVEDFF